MTRLTEAEGRQRWDEAIRVRGWQNSKLRLVMFDYRPAEHGPTLYRPAPAWPTIADDDNTADVEDYARIEQSLLAQGEPHSQRGAAAHSGCLDAQLVANPIPVRRGEIVATIERVMGKVHPLAITQEQILRAAFFVQLARELGQAIGTAEAAVHPERPTPSCDYVFTGTRGVGMRARYDLGFGHPSESAGITGVAELKGGLGTFDRLETLSRWDEESATDLETAAGESNKVEKPLLLDLLKLLDPKLPEEAFRISWIVSGKRGRSTTAEIRDRAIRIVERVAQQRNQSGATFRADPATGWLVCTWPQLKLQLELAWYRPAADNPERFEPVFAAEASSAFGSAR
jgi:hypothetical protein